MRDDISEVVDFLKKSSSNEFESKLNMLADVIFQADNVFLVGSGMSGIVAKYGARYFSSMGKFCLYIDEPHYPTESCFCLLYTSYLICRNFFVTQKAANLSGFCYMIGNQRVLLIF